MIQLSHEPFTGSLASALDAALDRPGLRAYWLIQAGFVLQAGDARVVVDPYLSDSLAVKYAGQEFPHRRMAPPPIEPDALTGVGLVLCTHGHTDHMDPGTLPPLTRANPGALVAVPAAERENALARGVPEAQLRAMDDGDRLEAAGVVVEALPSAHEELERDAAGHHHFLGYVIRMGGLALYHSGDCVPYPGLAERLRALKVDVAMLPINGRDAYRSSRGIIGNFQLEETVELCRAAGIGVLVGHHYGLFDFNTLDPADAERAFAKLGEPPRTAVVRLGEALVLSQ